MWTWFFTVHCIQRDFYEYISECHPFSVYLNSMPVKWTSTWKFEYLSLMLHNHSGPGYIVEQMVKIWQIYYHVNEGVQHRPCHLRVTRGRRVAPRFVSSPLCLLPLVGSPADEARRSPGAPPRPHAWTRLRHCLCWNSLTLASCWYSVCSLVRRGSLDLM